MLDRPEKARKLVELYADRHWRLDNLYYVQNESGERQLFRRRPAQQAFMDSSWNLDVIAKARQLGLSTQIGIDMCDHAVFKKNTSCGIIDFKLEDAKKKLQKIKFAYDGLPVEIRRKVTLTKDNEDELRFSNGSSIEIGTSHRGGTLQYLHVSELGPIAAEKPNVAKEIIKGAFSTIAPGQKIKVESTSKGRNGEFYNLVQRAMAALKEGKPLTALDFKLHFYGWWMDPKYVLPVSQVILTTEVIEYFRELKAKYNITVSGDQMAWYQKKLAELGWDDMKEEFPSHIDECFYNSLEGAYFKKEISKARLEKRIGHLVTYDDTRRVHTCWDKGINENSDQNAIWWFQHDGVRFRFIDYYENAGESLSHYISVVEQKRIDRKFVYGKHYGPHDLKARQWGDKTARTLVDIAEEQGLHFTIVDRVNDKEDSIEAARRALNNSWFDAEHCARGVECLENYRKTWNKMMAQWTNVPYHNWASNGADAFQQAAMGVESEKPDGNNYKRDRERKRGSQWAQ